LSYRPARLGIDSWPLKSLQIRALQVQNEKRRLELELAEVAEARHHQIMEAKALEQELVSLR
jgi:hypothetical protein